MCHGLLDVWALHLDGNHLARYETGLVHLGHGGGAQRNIVDGVEDVFDGGVVLAVHGLDIRAELGELAAEALGQYLRAHGEYLASLHESGAKLLEHVTQALGREAVEDVIAANDRENLADALEP